MTERKKSSRPSFADFKPRNLEEDFHRAQTDPESYRGLNPDMASEKAILAVRAKGDFEQQTINLKQGIVRRVLELLQERKLDLATATAEDMRLLREYLRVLVEKKAISESYAALIVRQWNATVRSLFGVTQAEALAMRGFRQFVRKIQHITEEDMAQIRQEILEAPTKAGSHLGTRAVFRNEHYRRVFYAYWELAQSTGCRFGSAVKILAEDIDEKTGTVRFRHMKNAQNRDHVAILTPRAARVLSEWVRYVKSQPWFTATTPILAGPEGIPITQHFVNKTLRVVAVRTGLSKPLSSHKIRASVGTIIGRENPKLAALQLGISDRIFNRHYNQPSLEDRLQRRDLLPGFELEGGPLMRPEQAFLARPRRRTDVEVG